jgi:hypothetical protein
VDDRQVLLSESERIRACGYAIDGGESVSEGVCIGVAMTFAAVQLWPRSAFRLSTVRMSPEHELDIICAVLDAARQAALSCPLGLNFATVSKCGAGQDHFRAPNLNLSAVSFSGAGQQVLMLSTHAQPVLDPACWIE